MRSLSTLAFPAALALSLAAFCTVGCDKKDPAPAPAPAPKTADAKPHDHDHKAGDDHGHGATVQLGEQNAGGFTIKASRDGDLKAGGEAAVDVWVSGGTAKVSAVRFWIGTQDGAGSTKAKADLEGDHYHTHVEVPNPMPAASKLWVEIEDDKGAKSTASFDLKA